MSLEPIIPSLYEQDYAAWLEITLEQLRSHALDNLDWAHLIEEIEDLEREQKNKLESYLRQLLKHLLQKAYLITSWQFLSQLTARQDVQQLSKVN